METLLRRNTDKPEHRILRHTAVGQTGILLWKLYLLRRHANYVGYHKDLILLIEWLFPTVENDLLTIKQQPYTYIGREVGCVVCANCLSIEDCGSRHGGKITRRCLRCSSRHMNTNVGEYELETMSKLSGIDRDFMDYLFCEAIFDLWQDNSSQGKGAGWINNVSDRATTHRWDTE